MAQGRHTFRASVHCLLCQPWRTKQSQTMSVAVSQLCNEVCLRPRVVHSPTSATTVHPPTSATVAHSSAYAVARCTFGGEICLSWRRAGVVPLVLKARRVQQASAAACIIINTDDRPLLAHGHTSEDGSEDLGNDIRIPCVVVQHRWAQFMLGECKSTICFDVTKQRQTNVDDVFSASNQPFKKIEATYLPRLMPAMS